MRILFLGDIVGPSGCEAVRKNLQEQIKINKINFVIVNGENSADQGVGITEKISKDFFNCGVDVITTGNHVWDQKEAIDYINKEKRLLRPYNLISPSPGKGFEIFSSKYSNIGIDYLEILDLETFSEPKEKTVEYIILLAAIIEDVRLIDNIEFKLEGG